MMTMFIIIVEIVLISAMLMIIVKMLNCSDDGNDGDLNYYKHDNDSAWLRFIYLLCFATQVTFTHINKKQNKRNAIQYTGGVDRETTKAGSQLLWAHIIKKQKTKDDDDCDDDSHTDDGDYDICGDDAADDGDGSDDDD